MNPQTPFHLLASACMFGLSALSSAAVVSTPNYESFESITVSSGRTPTVTVASAIHVKSNGSDYTQPAGGTVTYLIGGSVKVSANKWRVFNVQLGIGALPITNHGTRVHGITHLESFGSFYSAGVSQYPTKSYSKKNYPLQVPLGASGLGEFTAQRCNANKKGLQQQGLSNIAIFQKDRVISIPVAFHFAAQINDKDKPYQWYDAPPGQAGGAQGIGLDELYWRQATMWQDVQVVCEKSPDRPLASPIDPTPVPTGANDLALQGGVTQSFLTLLTQATPTGACGVKLSGVIETNLANTTVKFAYRNHKGVETPTRSLKTDHTKTVMFVDEIDFSKGKNTDDFGLTSGTGANADHANTLASTPSAKQFHGWYQIVGKNFKFSSNMAEYSFDCQPKTPGGLKGPSLGTGVFPATNTMATPAPVMPGALPGMTPRLPRATAIQTPARVTVKPGAPPAPVARSVGRPAKPVRRTCEPRLPNC